jgi:hypothetical protein
LVLAQTILRAADLVVPGDLRFERAIEFSNPDNQHLKLDLARPVTGTGPFPAIVCIHGGGFRGGGFNGGGWGLGAAGLAIGTGIALAATAPYAYGGYAPYGGYYDDDYYAYPRYSYGYGYPGYRRAYYGYRGYYPPYRRAYVYGGYPSYRRAYYGGYRAYYPRRAYAYHVGAAAYHRPYVRAGAYRRFR